MNTTIRPIVQSPQLYVRMGGVMYLLIILGGIFSELFVRGKLVVSGDAAATANNIIHSFSLWRLGIVTDLFMHVLDIPVMLIIYLLLRRVNRNIALLVLLFNLVQTAVLAADILNLVAAMLPLGNATYLKAVDPNVWMAQAYLSIGLHNYGLGIGLIFFGFVCILEGYMIYTSRFFPRWIGILMQIAGFCYLINSLALLLAPGIAKIIFPAILVPCFVAELSFSLWMIVRGINIEQWNKLVSGSGLKEC
jgi:hypothetical protein